MKVAQEIFLWFPRRVKTVEYLFYGGGNWKTGCRWLRRAYKYRGEYLDYGYVLHVALPPSVRFPGLEENPFVAGYPEE